ncbi:hypothetical protein LTR05_002844 [Lithohypha guttulata]|uniref:Uncharacterized protein n=1 Tax=Lithohypha guttulata TaxID=1690604 RepID=A0AAN7T5P0_9EURO|nr:hypothetical protein LTR05_002844 [Lithohypha guttulata]
MGATTFGTAVAIFVNTWLVGLIAFGIAATGIFLHILGAVDSTIGSSVLLSIVCAATSTVYLILQSISVSHTKQYRFHRLSLVSFCVHLSRALIALWIVTTTVGLWRALGQPLCKSSDVKADTPAWEAGLGCWIFRVLVALNVVMLIMSFSLFILTEINGRYVPIGLFHFEYLSHSSARNTPGRHRRRTLVNSAYGDSVEYLASAMTVTSEDEQNLTGSTEKQPRSNRDEFTISPSPTYRSIDFVGARSKAPAMPDHRLDALDQESILNLSSSRQSTITTTTFATVPLSHFPTTPTSNALTSSQFKSRHLSASNFPALPSSFQKQLKELEAAQNGAVANTPSPGARPALYNITNTSAGKLKSSCALPLSTQSSTTLATTINVIEAPEEKQPRPLSETIDKPAPAWCPTNLKADPLSSDPAIKRLTDFRRNSKLGLDRVSRRFSVGSHGFEFGFGGSTRAKPDNGNSNSNDVKEGAGTKGTEMQPTPTTDTKVEKATEPKKDEPTNTLTKPTTDTIQRYTKQSKRPGKNLSIMPPPFPPPAPDRSAAHGHGTRPVSSHSQSRKRGKSMVERGRYEKLPR